MKKQHRTAKESYRIRTHLIHGNHESKHWDFDHHLVPPISASAAYRLGSVHRGAQGFVEFASDEAGVKGHVPIYIYDRLDEPTRGMLEDHLAYAEGGERVAKPQLHSRREWQPSAPPWVSRIKQALKLSRITLSTVVPTA